MARCAFALCTAYPLAAEHTRANPATPLLIFGLRETAMLKIWGRRSSFNVQKVLWLAGELGLAREHIPAGGGFGRLNEPSFRKANPHGRVPVLLAVLRFGNPTPFCAIWQRATDGGASRSTWATAIAAMALDRTGP